MDARKNVCESRKTFSEVPVQEYSRIRLMFLPSAISIGKLFTDFSFPPDKSSLTYVYSGDDKYESMVFKRPKEIASDAVFAGVGGVYNTPFPWKHWKKGSWFEAAVAVVSLNFKQMDRLIPGYRHFEQSLQNEYIGCFCFKLWRFGEWIEIVVDDNLPTCSNVLIYCQAHGAPKEFWGPLVEKAYAKCKKTYEANESGRTLDALTDISGGVCDFYTPDINPPENLFHILYKSCVNRSQIVCWRNEKLLTTNGFMFLGDTRNNVEEFVKGKRSERYLHTVTVATKFPLSDGRMIEMVRLLCPFKSEPTWNGKFSDKDEISWCTVNMDFRIKYKPLISKADNEYWMNLEDFRCNFGGLIICSSEIPYTTESLSLERCYRRPSEDEIKSGQKSLFALNKERRRSSDCKHGRNSTTEYFKFNRNLMPSTYKQMSKVFESAISVQDSTPSEMGIVVREHPWTVKVDNTYSTLPIKKGSAHCDENNTCSSSQLFNVRKEHCSFASPKHKQLSAISCFKRHQMYLEGCRMDSVYTDFPNAKHELYLSKLQGDSEHSPNSITKVLATNEEHSTEKAVFKFDFNDIPCEHSMPHESLRKPDGIQVVVSKSHDDRCFSIISNAASCVSECASTFSTSDITLSMQGGFSSENSFARPMSAPEKFSRSTSAGSLPNMIVNNFLAPSSDNFRSHGSWRYIIQYKDTWEKSESGVSSVDMKLHPRNPRIPLNILQADAVSQIVAPNFHEKSHVIISLLQDYRHGASTANSLLVPIGFSIYKTKNPAKDEKKSLLKLSLVGEAISLNDSREIAARFDLVTGSYFIVPFCLSETHSGQFMVRVLAEKDPVAGKTGW